MEDSEIAAIAAATKALFDQRDLTMRAEMASMRATVDSMEAEMRDCVPMSRRCRPRCTPRRCGWLLRSAQARRRTARRGAAAAETHFQRCDARHADRGHAA